jgi:VanZ family protein
VRFLKYWLPVLVWAAIIVGASNDSLSSHHTEGVLHRFLSHYLSNQAIDLLNIGVRKLGHISEYGLLALLSLRAARGEERGIEAKWIAIAMLIVTFTATIDEIRQSFTTERTGSPWDVMLDVCGAWIVLMGVTFFSERRQQQRTQNAERRIGNEERRLD